jgi:hypothetical protein
MMISSKKGRELFEQPAATIQSIRSPTPFLRQIVGRSHLVDDLVSDAVRRHWVADV